MKKFLVLFIFLAVTSFTVFGQHYKNFKVAVYARAYEVREMAIQEKARTYSMRSAARSK